MISLGVAVALALVSAIAAPDLPSWCMGAGAMSLVIWMATPPKL